MLRAPVSDCLSKRPQTTFASSPRGAGEAQKQPRSQHIFTFRLLGFGVKPFHQGRISTLPHTAPKGAFIESYRNLVKPLKPQRSPFKPYRKTLTVSSGILTNPLKEPLNRALMVLNVGIWGLLAGS